MATVGEALNRRADLQKRIAQLEERVRASVLVQEGEEPPEQPEDLLTELDARCDELQHLIGRINHTNASTRLQTGETVTEALARRDVLTLRASALRSAIRAASDHGRFPRLTRSEIRMVRQVRISELQDRVDLHAKAQRELDNALQEHNWTTALIE
jgi:Family of unknown function (DUF6847)